MDYKYFYYWCTEIKLKRKISDILYSVIRKPDSDNIYGPPIKRKKIGGKSKKVYKKRRKYKKTKRNKYNKNYK